METVGERIQLRRKQMGKSVAEVAKDIGVSAKMFYRYESNLSAMPIDKLIKLSAILKITPDYLLGIITRNDSDLLYLIHSLDTARKKRIWQQVKEEYNDMICGKEFVDMSTNALDNQIVEVAGKVSAGTGQLIPTPEKTEKVRVKGKLPSYDFAVRVLGDSMSPLFDDGQIAYVNRLSRSGSELHSGQIIIASINGEYYIKKLQYEDTTIKLISLNTKYDAIRVAEWDEFDILGIVIL